MALKTFKPYTPSRRFLTMLDKSEITKQTPEKSLTESKKRTGGRNSHGEVTVVASRRRPRAEISRDRFPAREDGHSGEGGGDRIRPEPVGADRAAALCGRREALHSAAGGPGSGHDGAERRRRGHSAGKRADVRHIPPGTMVHNLELYPGKGGQVVRAAGGAAQLLSKEGDVALVKLPSGEVRKFSVDCMATIGQLGNLDHENVTYGKAGRTRWHGKRPTVRGVAMNPVDHPHGGGEGRVKGNHPQTPWGFPTLGAKTRKKRPSDRMIVERRKP